MNYRRIYNQIIEKRQKDVLIEGYRELHHIIPKSLGGSDRKENLVFLSAREHYICHYLLVKMFREGSRERNKMLHALNCMQRTPTTTNKRYFNSTLYESLRKEYALYMSGKMKIAQKGSNNSQFGSIWITDRTNNRKIPSNENIPNGWFKGRSFPPKIKKKLEICSECISEKEIKLPKHLIFGDIRECRQCAAHKYYRMFSDMNYTSANKFVKDGHYPFSVVSLTKLWNEIGVGYNPSLGRGKIKK